MARPTIAAQSLVSQFGDVRPTHHDANAGRANRVGNAISLGDHASHGANADQFDLLIADVLRDLSLIHGLGIAVDQENFVSRRSQRLQQEHPQVRHEIPRDAIIGVIEQDSHDSSSCGRVPFTPWPSRAKPRTAKQPGRAMQKDGVGFPVSLNCTPLPSTNQVIQAASARSVINGTQVWFKGVARF
jgi:hypothetical protein